MRYFIVFVIALLSTISSGQLSLSGIVKNQNGEVLSFATVYLVGTNHAAATDDKGFFVIKNIPRGIYDCKVSYIGYAPVVRKIDLKEDQYTEFLLTGEIYNLDRIEIHANRSNQQSPFTKTNHDKIYLQKENLGQDVPFLLQWTPSMVVTSDAGTGIGYTSMRLRGSDQTRINVTINGVPLNDAESQNVFWVDLPDLMGSVKNIQIQRGVGTSSNGPGAFGGTVSISTHDHRLNPHIGLSAGYGSFNTRRLQVSAGTGLLNSKYFVEGKTSFIKSDGYVDRATADLSSLNFSAGRVTGKSSLRLNILSGKETTYQAWYGTPESKLQQDLEALQNHYFNNLGSVYKTKEDSVNLFNSDRRYNYYTYPNQVDNYRQTHYQLIWSAALSEVFKVKSTLFYTKGKGYFEEFRASDKLENYGLADINQNGMVIKRSDIVRRRWLDNDFYGFNGDAEYRYNKQWLLSTGINLSRYVGAHFGNVISASEKHPDIDKTKKYYDNTGKKSDFTSYVKVQYQPKEKINIFGDLQWRKLHYFIDGTDNDLRSVNVTYTDNFINPKLGISYMLKNQNLLYLSYAYGQKEPSRSDFIDQVFQDVPKAERLHNFEAGWRYESQKLGIENNMYYMKYNDQLVLTGELNDVGAPVRINVPDSYRLGWESSATYEISKMWTIHTNFTISKNKIKEFEETVADYTNGFEKVIIKHQNTDISFSPVFIKTVQILFKPGWGLETELSSKFVSSQHLDNTSNNKRQLPAYHFQNVRITKTIQSKYWKLCTATLMINNILDAQYVSNGYTYTYIFGQPITENYYYPQAGRNFLLGIQFGF